MACPPATAFEGGNFLVAMGCRAPRSARFQEIVAESGSGRQQGKKFAVEKFRVAEIQFNQAPQQGRAVDIDFLAFEAQVVAFLVTETRLDPHRIFFVKGQAESE